MIVYLNKNYSFIEDTCISPLDRGFLFSDGVYESIRTYNRKLFRYGDHLARLQRSLAEIKINYNENSFRNVFVIKVISLSIMTM